MIAASLHVLLVEDNPGDARLVQEFLRDIPGLELHHADHLAAGLDHLVRHAVDVTLLDLGLPDSQGLDTVSKVVAAAPGTPIIVLTGLDDEVTGVAAVRAGAEDYLTKGEWAGQLLLRTIRYAIERNENQAQLRHLNQVLRAIHGVNQLIVREHDAERLITQCCEELVRPGGYDVAVVGLVDMNERVTMFASAASGTREGSIACVMMDATWPGCIEAIRHEGVLSGEALEQFCAVCPSPLLPFGCFTTVSRLECRKQLHGFLGVSRSDRVKATQDEQALLQGVADDLALGLHGIEEQRRRENAEALISVRLQLLEFSGTHRLEEVLQKTLDEVEALTQSQVGFYHFVEADQRTIALQAWSTRTKNEFCQAQGAGLHYDLDSAGIWTECIRKRQPVIHNDYASIPNKKGLPPDHVEVIRELVVPIFRNEKIVAILGVGNKPTDYTKDDLTTVTLLADVAWEIITRKRIETALRLSENRYRRLFESAKDGILIVDADTGKIVDVNPFLSQLLGYSYESFIGKIFWEMGLFSGVAASRDAFVNLKEGELFRFNDLPLETTDGRIVDVEFAGNAFQVDQTKVIQCNFRDITERKKTEAERERLRSAIEQAGEMIVITDPAGIIQYVNPAFSRTTGYTTGEIIGRNMNILKSGKQEQAFYDDLWATILSGKTWTGRVINKRKNGTLYTEDATISPVFDPAGKTVNYVAVKHDITGHLQLEDQLRQAQKMESVGRLAGGVAHDYNNMLTVILGNTELALIQTPENGPLHECLDEIFSAGKRSAEITRQLLAFARKQTIAPQALDLNEAVEGMLKMLRRLIGEDIDLTWRPEMKLWPVKMDPSQIDQILANLCVNARDAIDGVGKITIATGMETFHRAKSLEQMEAAAGDFVFLSVTDNGCGMDKETMDKIFEPFFTTKRVGKGTGLGLSTVYGIVKQNNGFINVFSEPEKGTTFKIYLPRHKANAEQTQAKANKAIPRSRGETVLIVEDELPVLNLSRSMLDRLGYSVLTASSPTEALRLVESHSGPIHLLMTDVVMPGMNGRELAQRLHALYPDMQRLFMSGYTADVIAPQCTQDENSHFIQKPFYIKDIAIKLRQVLDR